MNKNTFKIAPLIVGLAFFVVNTVAIAQDSPLTRRQDEILREVASVDGTLSHSQYEEFWGGFKDLRPNERENFRKSFQSQLPAILRYQRTLWLAANESYKQHKPVITSELRREFEQMRINGQRNSKWKNYSIEMKRSALALLEGAAYRTPINKDGSTFPKDSRIFQITPEVIDQVLRGLDGSIARLDHLLADSW